MISTDAKSTKRLLYLEIADEIEYQIDQKILRPGDKIPSIRSICNERNVSMSTVQLAYSTLLSKSIIESRPKSGYFVSEWLDQQLDLPQISKPDLNFSGETDDILVSKVFDSQRDPKFTRFSSGAPSNELLPITQLNKALKAAMNDLPGSGTENQRIGGNEELRHHIKRWLFPSGVNVDEKDIITTNGCLNAVSYCLMTLMQRGDTIVVESPIFFGLLQLFESLGLNVIELPTHANTGIDIDALKKVLKRKKVKACLLVSNFSNPLGSCMPDEHKIEVVRLLSYYGIPLIEDGIYSDLYFGDERPKSCKSFDEEGNVLYCGSVSKTLAPGYRVGWVLPGKYKDQVTRYKMVNILSTTTITEQAVAHFFKSGKYESYLRQLRRTLQSNCTQYSRAISEYFPKGTKISRPEGGLYLWIELSNDIDTAELFDRALKKNISIAPGRIFTLQNHFNNCMRLSYCLPWSNRIDSSLKTLSELL